MKRERERKRRRRREREGLTAAAATLRVQFVILNSRSEFSLFALTTH